jgi:phosphatidylglycerophosphate synthase
MAGTIQQAAETKVLDQAVLLTTTGLFGTGPAQSGRRDIIPLTKVGGLTLFQRTVLTLQRAGFSKVLVLAGEQEESLRRSVRDDPRITMSFRWMPVREFPVTDAHTWEALSEEIKGPCLLVGPRAMFGRGLVERLCREVGAGETALLVVHREARPSRTESRNPIVAWHEGRLTGVAERSESLSPDSGEWDPYAADLLVLPGPLLGMAATSAQGTLPIRHLLERLAPIGRVKVVEAQPDSGDWYHPVRGHRGAAAAERVLFRSLRGPFEGFVDTYFNRKISAMLSRLFLAVNLSPNAVTLLSIAIGLAAAALFGKGGYAAGVVGALLFQLSAIVDCCDGEVARLTFTESKWGERLDLIGDNIVHMALFAGIAWGAFTQSARAAGSPSWYLLALGAAAIGANVLSLWLVSRAKAVRDRGGWHSPEQAARVEFILKNLASRDFSVALLAFALAGLLPWFLWLTAIGANAFWVMLAWVSRTDSPASRA